ncbi:hypothetical protein GCM10011409_19180 [Lentibacillus populi]|uniref:Gp28/Gp37-like domain-containing protein n=1 Tax=Lentibacillus populi TaxID=1827502 RepID=A0A9W5X595_9BACI|nr:hypothetical protein [Lentibacillus populi]GGB41790.1 hypothetical protein GCM10011409_19180 [Lentibacillus populi]
MKQPIRIYNRFLDREGEMDRYQSLQFRRSYHGIADFELHVNRYMHEAKKLNKGNIISLGKQNNKAAIIITKEIVLDENGKETENFKLTGYTLDGLMSRRITVPPSHTSHDRKSGSAETVMKHYVNNHFVNPTDPERKMPHVEVAPDLNRGVHIEWESRFKNVAEQLENISIKTGLGWGIFTDFKTKKLIFDVIDAKDLTQGNLHGYNPVFFSPEFETTKSQSFVDSDNDLKTVGYIGGQGEGIDRKIIILGNKSGWDRIETFVDARDIGTTEDGEEEPTEEELDQQLVERGKEKMSEMVTVYSLDAEIITPVKKITPFQYEKDYDLGDKVQVVNKSWGLKMSAPITEFLEIYEDDGFRLEATFGRSRPTLISKLNDKFNELSGVEKQELPAQIAVETKQYTNKKLSEEERKRIEQARENLEASKKHAEDYTNDYTYDKSVIDDKDSHVEEEAKKDATNKANAAQAAAEKVAEAKAKLAEEQAKAHADGKITEEEKARIKQAEENLNAAKAEAKAKADAAERAANAYSEAQDKKVRDDAKGYADQAEKNAKDFSEDASNIMKGILDVGAVPIRTAANGARISFDGINGFVQYDKNDNPVAWFDLEGNARFSGDITGSSGTFGEVTVDNGDFTLKDEVTGMKYIATPGRNLIKDHSFELVKADEDSFGQTTVDHNWLEMKESMGYQRFWEKSGNPRVAIQWSPDNAKALAIYGQQAICVRNAHFVRQRIYEGIGGDKMYTLSGFFKRQWNVVGGGQPRFEVDYIAWDNNGNSTRTRLLNEIFAPVPDDYSVVRHSVTFTVPTSFKRGDELDLKISGGNTEWVQCDGVQLVEGIMPRVYQPEDSVWEMYKGYYPVINQQKTLWAGAIYLNASHVITPEKPLKDCTNGWILKWSNYVIGNGPTDTDWQFTYIPKSVAYDSGGHRTYLRSGNETEVFKYYYISNTKITGHNNNGNGVNRNMCLREVLEF